MLSMITMIFVNILPVAIPLYISGNQNNGSTKNRRTPRTTRRFHRIENYKDDKGNEDEYEYERQP